MIQCTRMFFKQPYDLQFETVKMDKVPDPESVLVRSLYSLISPGTELALYTGTHVGIPDPGNTFAKFPFYPGYSVVGIVEAVGKNVKSFAEGDIVYTIGKHATYNIVPCSNANHPVVKLTGQNMVERAPFARLAAICMTGIVQTSIRFGDCAVVLGLGLIGNLAAQLYSILGAQVIGVDLIEKRLDIARQTSIDHTVLSGSHTNLRKVLLEITGDAEPDIVVEATGSPQMVIPSLELVRKLGQVVALGSTRGNVDLNVYEYVHRKGVRWVGAHEGLQNEPGFVNRSVLTRYVMKLIEIGALSVDPLLTHKLPYKEAKHGYELLLNKQDEALGILLDWTERS